MHQGFDWVYNVFVKRSKIILLVLVSLFLSFLFIPGLQQRLIADEDVNFGDTEFSDAYQKYKTSIEQYNDRHSKYVIARTQYFAYKTLTSQNNAQVATSDMMVSRVEVLLNYLEVLKLRFRDSEGVSDDIKNENRTFIDGEINWFNTYKGRIVPTTPLLDMQKLSDEERDRYNQLKNKLYPRLYSLFAGRIDNYRNRLLGSFDLIKGRVEIIKKDERSQYKLNDYEIENIDRWINETNIKLTKSSLEQTAIRARYPNISNLREFDASLTGLDKVRTILLKGVTYLGEIIREIKYED